MRLHVDPSPPVNRGAPIFCLLTGGVMLGAAWKLLPGTSPLALTFLGLWSFVVIMCMAAHYRALASLPARGQRRSSRPKGRRSSGLRGRRSLHRGSFVTTTSPRRLNRRSEM